MKFIATVILLIVEGFVFAQTPLVKQWDKRYGGTYWENLFALKQTKDGGFILGGTSNSEITGDKTQPSQGMEDYWIVKLDSLGNYQWDKRFGGSSYEELESMEQTQDGGYILGGYSLSDSSGDKTQPSRGQGDYWVVKIDSLGNKQWDKRFGGSDDDYLLSVKQTTDGGYILGGFSYSGNNGDKTQPSWGYEDCWVIKIDSSGNKQWDRRFGGTSSDYMWSIQQTTDGGYILGGASGSDSTGDVSQHSRGSIDYWIVKINPLGVKQWDKLFGGSGAEDVWSIEQTLDGGYVVGGRSNSRISGDKTQDNWDTVGMGGLGLTYDYWIVKVDSVGNKGWEKRFGGRSQEDEFGGVAQTSDGGYIFAGTSYSDSSGEKTENNLGGEQGWIVKMDSSGNILWDKTMLTLGHDEVSRVVEIKNRCYVMGSATGGGIGGYKTQPNWDTATYVPYYNTPRDYWIIKFCDTSRQCNLSSATLTANRTTFCSGDSAQVCAPTGYSYHWNTGGTTSCIKALFAGNYYVTVSDNNGCTAESNHLAITVYPLPPVAISVNGDTLSVYGAVTQQWYLNGSAINGATDSIYIAHTGGSYTVQVADTNGCVATSLPVIVSGVENITEEDVVSVFPNPTNNNWQLTVGSNFIGGEAIVTDADGRVVFQQLITNLPAGQAGHQSLITFDAPRGIYLLRISSSKSNVVRKLVKL